jgi:hypothetical protein
MGIWLEIEMPGWDVVALNNFRWHDELEPAAAALLQARGKHEAKWQGWQYRVD